LCSCIDRKFEEKIKKIYPKEQEKAYRRKNVVQSEISENRPSEPEN
jgi:hypothetical protein